jgi:hypothetical protein
MWSQLILFTTKREVLHFFLLLFVFFFFCVRSSFPPTPLAAGTTPSIPSWQMKVGAGSGPGGDAGRYGDPSRFVYDRVLVECLCYSSTNEL